MGSQIRILHKPKNRWVIDFDRSMEASEMDKMSGKLKRRWCQKAIKS